MASVNKVILVGNCGKDPELRYTPSGDAIANVSIATTDTWKDKETGEKKSATEWHRVVFYKKLAEIVGQYVKKGSPLYIEGRLKTRKWQGQDGQDRYTTEIVADSMQLLGSRPEGTGQQQRPQGNPGDYRNARDGGRGAPPPPPSGGLGDFSDDIPW